MGSESMDVRLARMEEGLVRLHDKISSNHMLVMSALKPVQSAPIEIARLKQNNRWVVLIATLVSPIIVELFEMLRHHG